MVCDPNDNQGSSDGQGAETSDPRVDVQPQEGTRGADDYESK